MLIFKNVLSGISTSCLSRFGPKETTLERADFTLQLLMFVTAEKDREMFLIISLSDLLLLLSPWF